MESGQQDYSYDGSENRRYPRFRLTSEVVCYLIQLEDVIGRVVDISAGGMCVAAPESFQEDSRIIARLALPCDSQEIELKARVVWSKRTESLPNSMGFDLRYRVGIEFTEISDDDRLRIAQFVSSHLIQE